MKIRTDFVTNSSSSSFILARKGELTDKQKEAILQFIEEKMFGRKMLTPENTEEEIQKVFEEEYICEDTQEKIRRALKEGKTIFGECICFEFCDSEYMEMFMKIWELSQQNGEENFEVIEDDMTY